MYGGFNETAKVFKIVKGKPVFITQAEWCTAATYGKESEVMQALIRAKALPRKWFNFSNKGMTGSGYYIRDNGKFLIHSI